jgi:predicted nucleic acid-binding Zn ribbon protein
MFCDQCGAQLQAGQSHCSRCGKAVLGPQQVRYNRVQEHIRLLGILWIVYSMLHVLGAAFVLVLGRAFLSGIFHIPNGPPPEFFQLLRPIITFIGWLLIAKAAAGLIAGWGLLQRESWARILTLVTGFLALLHPLLGTALGIYTLWVLLPAQSDAEYKTLCAAA